MKMNEMMILKKENTDDYDDIVTFMKKKIRCGENLEK